MKKFFSTKKYLVIGLLVVGFVGWYFFGSKDNSALASLETGLVERGEVVEVVSETGFVKAAQSVNMAFERGGRVSDVLVQEGSVVTSGDVLAKLDDTTALADLAAARARLAAEQSRLQELLSGADENSLAVTQSSLEVAKTALANAKQNLIEVTAQQNQLVKNAEKNLRNSNLQAYLIEGGRENSNDSFLAPTVTGVYNSEEEGSYVIELYNSGAQSGSSFRVSGLEEGVSVVSTVNPVPVGARGLFLQFPEGYAKQLKWEIPIPNNHSSSYQTNLNAYKAVVDGRTVAITAAESAVKAAEAAVDQGQAQLTLVSGSARTERVAAQQALVEQMQAAVMSAEAQVDNLLLKAPFSGVVTKVNMELGQIIGATVPVVSLISNGQYELKVLISEVDIAEVSVADEADVKFDAYDDVKFKAHVTQIAPSAQLVDGVRVFAVTLVFDKEDEQIRDGLSADIDITTAKREGVIAIPTRAIYQDAKGKFVRTINGDKITSVYITTGLRGSDGKSEVLQGLSGGESIVTFASEEAIKQLEKSS